MNCASCRHSQPTIIEADGDLVLVCRRYPPTVTLDPDGDWVSSFGPVVNEDEACGEWAETEWVRVKRKTLTVRRHEKRQP